MATYFLTAAQETALDTVLTALTATDTPKHLLDEMLKILDDPNTPIATPPGRKGFLIMALNYYFGKTLTAHEKQVIDSLTNIVGEYLPGATYLIPDNKKAELDALLQDPAIQTPAQLIQKIMDILPPDEDSADPGTKIPPGHKATTGLYVDYVMQNAADAQASAKLTQGTDSVDKRFKGLFNTPSTFGS